MKTTAFFLTIYLVLASNGFAQVDVFAKINSARAEAKDTLNSQMQTHDTELSVDLNIENISLANSVSIGIGNTSLTADGIATIFEVVGQNNQYNLVEQNVHFPVTNGQATVSIHLAGALKDYKDKYAIITVSDKTGHQSSSLSVKIHTAVE